MEDKNMRELSMDEMDKVSGGDLRDSVGYWMDGRSCPNCSANRLDLFSLEGSSIGCAQIRCKNCRKSFMVRK